MDITEIEAGILVEDFWAIVTAELGAGGIKAVDGEEWVGRIQDLREQLEEAHPYRPLMAMLEEGSFDLGSPRAGVAKRTKIDGIEEEEEGMAEEAISCERVCEAIRKNLQVLKSAGFFDAISEATTGLDAISRVGEQVTTFGRSGFDRGMRR